MKASPTQIQTWLPRQWTDIVGNTKAKKCLLDSVRSGTVIPNALFVGDSRTGKTTTIKQYVRSLMCARRSTDLNPCGTCDSCRDDVGTREFWGLYSWLGPNAEDRERQSTIIHFVPIDCTRIEINQLENILCELPRGYGNHAIVYLDEIGDLFRRGLDKRLLKPMEEMGDLTWIASGADVSRLDRMFLNRFPLRLRTESPTEKELVLFLARRCGDWELDWGADENLVRLARRAKLNPGLALQVLACAAATPERQLTREFVEDYDFIELAEAV